MPDLYSITSRYRSRARPRYDDDPADGVTWQPDVYEIAATVGAALDSRRIVDIGCGRGAKLAALHPRFEIAGLDFGPNIEHCRQAYPYGTWFDHDLESDGPLPVPPDQLDGAVVVCADVIEHMISPERLLDKLAEALPMSAALLISTPERELWSGQRDVGPPRNACHVREWSMREFGALLRRHGFVHHSLGLTRSNDRTEELHTILAAVAANAERLTQIEAAIVDFAPAPPNRHPAWHRMARIARIVLRG